MPSPMISETDRAYIRTFFAEKMTGEVAIDLYTQTRSALTIPGREECQYCDETQRLLEEVAALSERVKLNIHDARVDPDALARGGVDRVPALVFSGAVRGTMRFFGIPAGNEFRNLIDGLVEASTGESNLAPQTREALAALDQDVHIQVFVTPT